MLQNSVDLVLLDTFRHHIHKVAHHGSAELEIKVRLHTLLSDRLRNTLAVTSFKLSREKVTKPAPRNRNQDLCRRVQS